LGVPYSKYSHGVWRYLADVPDAQIKAGAGEVPGALAMRDFATDGFEVVEAQVRGPLGSIRGAVRGQAVADLETYHTLHIDAQTVNENRLGVMKALGGLDLSNLIYTAFQGYIDRMVGPDLLAQKGPNLVIQRPGDTDVAPVHRDAPLNSPFELIVWLPLVDCSGTRGMKVLTKGDTARAVGMLPDYGAYSKYAFEHGISCDVPFGSALMFWSGLVHAVPVNTTDTTRWSLNHRFRSLFAPAGPKGTAEYFRVLHTSPLTELGLSMQQESLNGSNCNLA
jgi:sporadic carbohydrate cluster 2OG-Fe(II) oxygenase